MVRRLDMPEADAGFLRIELRKVTFKVARQDAPADVVLIIRLAIPHAAPHGFLGVAMAGAERGNGFGNGEVTIAIPFLRRPELVLGKSLRVGCVQATSQCSSSQAFSSGPLASPLTSSGARSVPSSRWNAFW
jgi:hypothetical protein